MGEMNTEEFREALAGHFDRFTDALATDTGDWVVKGFIDVYRRIYTISIDTKVVSKIIELMLFPVISRVCRGARIQINTERASESLS